MTKYLLNNTRNTIGNSATALKGNSMLFTNSFDGLPMFFKSIALTLAMLVVGIGSSWGQVSTYTKSITSGTYTAHTGTVLLTNADDADASASNIGFNFSFAGVVYTQFVANSNGYITLGGTGQGSWYTPLSSINNVIAAVARDGKATGDVRVEVQGVAPNRVCNIQYTNFDLVYNLTTRRVSFQIQLFETTNRIDIIYTGATGTTTTLTVQVGLRGASTADFNNYSGSNANWAALPGGTANTNTVSWGSSQSATRSMPSNGIILRWTPPVVAACSGTPAPGTTVTSSASVAPGSTVNLSLSTPPTGTGLTYQWQSAPTSTGSWTNFGTSSATQTSPAITSATWYRCIVTCSGVTGTSTAVPVSLDYCSPTGTPTYYISNMTTTGGATNISNSSGANAGYGNFTAQSASNSIGTGTSFSVAHSATSGGAGVGVWIDWNNDLDFADANEQIGITTGWNYSPYTGTINIPVGTPAGSYRMRIVIDYSAISPISCPVAITGETEDYTFTVTAATPCSGTPAPGTTVTSSTSVVSGSTVNLSLSTPPTGTGLTYQWQSAPTSTGSWTTISTSAATYTATVSATTWYRCIVTCSGNTGTSTPVQVTLSACVPNSGSGCSFGDLIASVTLNTLVNNSGTACVAAYNNYTTNPSLTTTLLPSSSYNCIIGTGAYGQDFAVWIDYNDDLVFDVTERVGYTTSTVPANSSATFNISLACTPSSGPHIMRVRSAYATAGISITPCGTQSYGEVEDYKITIAAPPACATPGLMSSITPTTTSATLTWATNCSAATNYDFQYGPTGFTLGTGTILSNQAVTISAPNASFNLTGLTQNTTYQVYYRANCGSGVYSAWSIASSITTLCAPSGDELTSGAGSWIGYVYNSASAGAFTSYKGYVTEAETFNTSHATTPNGATVLTCPANSDLFAIRYKMTKTFASGNYVFTVGGDDGVRLSIDGGATWLINGWLNQSYTSYSSSSVALSGAVNLVFEFYENSGGAQSSFSYAAAPVISSLSSNAICPNATITIAGANFTGITNVSFNGVAATSYTVVSSTSITAVAPASVTSGSVTVTNSVSTATSSSYTVNAFPATPTASVSGSSTINVGGTTTLTSTAGGSTLWYTAATGGTSVALGSPFTTAVQCTPGTITYYAEDNNGTCASNARGAVSFTVRPMIGSNPSNALICSSGGSVILSAQLTGGSSITWSPNTNLSTSSGSSTIASPTATTIYTMSATVTGCGSVSTTQSVGVIDAVAFTPTATPTAVCAGNTAALASNLSSAGFTYNTTTFAMATPSSQTNLCSGGVQTVALASGSLDDGGWSAIPIGFTYNFFGSNYTTLNIGTNGVIQFGAYDATSLGDFTYATSFPTTSEPMNIIAAAANDYYATVSGTIRYWSQGIAPTRTFVAEWNAVPGYTTNGSMTVQVKLFETTGIVEIHVQNASSSNNKVVGLQNSDASIGATAYASTNAITNTAWKFIPGANYTFQWATAGSNIGSATSTNYTTPVLSTPGTVTYSVAATNPNTQCTTTQSVNVTVNALPSAPVSAGDITACNTTGSQNLVVSTGSGETADWYASSTGGSVLASGDNVLSYSTATAATYYAEAQNTTTGCVSATRTGVTLTVNTSPAAPTAPAATYCQGETATALTASSPSGSNTQSWYTVPSGGTPLSGAPIPSTASTGTTIYYVSETSGSNGCESTRTSVSVTVNATPSAPVASNPAAYCQNDIASALTATATAGNTLYWYTVPTGGTGSSTAPTPSTATAGTINYYVADRSNASGCEGSRTTVTVTVNPTITASVSNSASSSSVCGGGAITFTATPTNGGTPTYQWYLNGNPVGSNSATYTINVASDNASNYASSWINGSNLGSGLNAWSITNNSNTGYFLGNPSNDGNGTANIGTTAHGIWATGSNYINASRGLTNPMQIGDELRFYWVFNWDANFGGKGFDIKSGGTNIFNVNNSGSAIITAGSLTADGSYGTTPMYVQITRTSASLYTFTMTRRSDGSTFSTTFSSSLALDEISFYIGGQNDGSGQRNLYFNGIELRPPSNNDAIYVEMTPTSQACLASTAATASNTVSLSSSPATPTTAIQSSASSAFCPGTSLTFSVNSSANMGSSPTYQWNLNGSPISNETNSTLVSTSLANNDQVTLTMTSSLSAGCLTQSSATSAAIISAVNNSTTITAQPIAVSSCLGGTQSFSVSCAGTGTLTYQWKKNGTNITGNSTANTATLTLAGISSGDVANYTVVVTGTCGTVTSSAAALSLNAATAISVQPSAVTACTATNAIFSVTATGYGTVTYQWRKDGTPISGETSSSYTATGVTSSNVGNYSVVVTGGCGNVTSSNAALAVQPATVISSQPSASTICQNNSANFSVTASGQGTLTYQWQLNGASISGATSSGLSVSNAQASNAGSITVVVTGACGSSTSNAATFTVNPNTSISTQPVGSTTGCNIQNYTFSVVAAGTSLSYQWNFASANVGNNSASYAISNATTANDGNYYVTVSGACGNPVNSNTVALSVNASPIANAGADITGASTCGKNTIPLGASTLSSGTTGLWSLVSGNNQILFGLSGTSETSDFTGSYGQTYTLGWTVTNTTTNCTNTDNMVVTFNQPNTSSLGTSIGDADFLWNGLTNVDWSTGGNWFRNVSGVYQLQTGTIEPTSTNQVFSITAAQGGVCIGSNMPTIGNGDNALDVFVGSGITLNLANGSLNLSGNLVNNGTINAAQGTVNFIGSTNATISGSGATTLNNVTINKSSGATLTLSTNVAVNGILNMTQGNVFTATSPNGLLTLGASSAVPGTLSWTSGNIVGPFRRFFTTAATQGNEGLFPVGTATFQRYAKVNFTASPGTNQSLTAWYKTSANTLYNGLPLTTQDGQLIQNYSADGYWQIDPTDNNYNATINSANYSIELYANNLTGMQDPTICRIIKAAGSNTSSSNHVQWQGCGTHTTIPTGTSASAFAINSTSVGGFSWFGVGTSNNQALPVELTSFSGNCADGKVVLDWSTATEHNSAYFQVEYSRDGSVWQNIGIVAAAGNSVQNINYTLPHEQVASGDNYYRLRQVDIDGVEKLYDVIAVNCAAGSDHYIMSYPNPSEQNFQVALLDENLIGTATLSMVDARGMLIHSELLEVKAGTNLFLFNNTGLAPGIYYVKISKGAYSSEVVKQVVR